MSDRSLDENLFLDVVGKVAQFKLGEVSLDSQLMSGDNPVDSVTLVEICVRLEDLALDLGFDFDWMSEDAMSRSRSIFRTFGTLFDEFSRQMIQKM